MPTLNWIGKDAVVKHHKEVPFRLLEPDAALSCPKVGAGDTANSAEIREWLGNVVGMDRTFRGTLSLRGGDREAMGRDRVPA